MKIKNSVIENFEKALVDICHSVRKENLNLDIYKDNEKSWNF